MFQQEIRNQPLPKYLSSDNDPLFRFHQWQANLRILAVQEIKTAPYAPLSHPFVERLIGTIRRECVDLTLFWTRHDLESKLRDFQDYYNHHRTHSARAGCTPQQESGPKAPVDLGFYRWRRHCGGLYQTPMAA
jgi:transposase InsO family protein